MRQVVVPGTQRTVAVIGQGTWGVGLSRRNRSREVEALRLGVSLGMTLIDTAEFYSAGGAEEVVGDAVADCRDQVFLVTKVWPSNAGYAETLASVKQSLRRLHTDRIDAVLLHWPTRSVPLRETFRAFADLQRAGAVGAAGVSNFGPAWLRRAKDAAPSNGDIGRLAFNQVPYSLGHRQVERAILPYAQQHGQVVMAYSPLGHGRMPAWRGYSALIEVAAARGTTPAQIALAFLTSRPGVVAIPKAVRPEHVRANAAAASIALTPGELRRLERAFPLGRAAEIPILPPYTVFFRLILWAATLQIQR